MKAPIDQLKEKLFQKPDYSFVGYHSILADTAGSVVSGLLLSYLLKTYTFQDIKTLYKVDFIGAKNALAMSDYEFNIAFNQLAGNKIINGEYNEEEKVSEYSLNISRILELIRDNHRLEEYL